MLRGPCFPMIWFSFVSVGREVPIEPAIFRRAYSYREMGSDLFLAASVEPRFRVRDNIGQNPNTGLRCWQQSLKHIRR